MYIPTASGPNGAVWFKAASYLWISSVNWSTQILLYLALRLNYLCPVPTDGLTFFSWPVQHMVALKWNGGFFPHGVPIASKWKLLYFLAISKCQYVSGRLLGCCKKSLNLNAMTVFSLFMCCFKMGQSISALHYDYKSVQPCSRATWKSYNAT